MTVFYIILGISVLFIIVALIMKAGNDDQGGTGYEIISKTEAGSGYYRGVEVPRGDYVILDLETTGFSPTRNKIIEIAALKVKEGQVIDKFNRLIDHGVEIPEKIVEITGIDNDLIAKQGEPADKTIRDFWEFIDGNVIAGHNIKRFDLPFLVFADERFWQLDHVDTLTLARKVFPSMRKHALEYLSKILEFVHKPTHRAESDVMATMELMSRMGTEIVTD